MQCGRVGDEGMLILSVQCVGPLLVQLPQYAASAGVAHGGCGARAL